MAEPRVNDGSQPLDHQSSTDQIDQLRTLVANLSEADQEFAAAELMRDVLPDEVKMVVAAEAVKTAHGEAQQVLVTQAVKSADSFEARKAATAAAVNSAAPENKVKVAAVGVEQLTAAQQKELVDRLPITPVTADEIWRMVVGAFRWVLWGSTLALVAAVGVALFREVDQALVQILLTVFTTVAGIFAGFIGGKGSRRLQRMIGPGHASTRDTLPNEERAEPC